MLLVASLLNGLAQVLGVVLNFVMIVVIIGALLSWVNPDPSNPIVRFIRDFTEPLLRPFRRVIPIVGPGIDLSPIALLLTIIFLRYALVAPMIDYAGILRARSLSGITF